MTNQPNKTSATAASVAGFISTVDSERRRQEAETLLGIFGRASGQDAVMWGPSIIGFGSSHYRYATGREGDTATTVSVPGSPRTPPER